MKNLKITIFLSFLWLFTLSSYAQTTTLMSYNIRYDNLNDNENWWEKRKLDVVQLINHYQPDILGIQEGLSHQVGFIKDKSKHYKYVGVGRDDGLKKGEYTAIYFNANKLEMLRTETFWLSPTPEKVSVGWDASMERICTYAHLKNFFTKQEFHVFNAHFDHIGPKARLASAKLILAKIKELKLMDKRVIVMGDFNCEPVDAPILALKSLLIDGLEQSKNPFYGPIGTFNGFKLDADLKKRIDYIFTLNVKTKTYSHIDDRRPNKLWVSDHLPIMTKIK